jgi:hypothetical protein
VNPPRQTLAALEAENSELRASIVGLQNARVEEWVALIRYGSTVPLAVERSFSWRVTRPIRLAQTAVLVYKRDGANRFWATVFYRIRRLVTRK